MSFIFDPLQHFFPPSWISHLPLSRRSTSLLDKGEVGCAAQRCIVSGDGPSCGGQSVYEPPCKPLSFISSCLVRLDQDFWQVLHRPDAAHFKQHGGEAGRGSSPEVHLVRDFILLQVVGDCRRTQAGGYAQVSHSSVKRAFKIPT